MSGPEALFGYFPTPLAASYESILSQARLADELGLDVIAIQDHPYQPRFLDAPTLLTAVAVQTKRIRVLTDVANLQVRQPALLAKWAASLDVMTHGRVVLGLGSGAFARAVAAMGIDPKEAPEAVSALEEAIQLIRLWWTGERVQFDGRFFKLRGVHAGPVPAHPIAIWVGAYGPRALGITGRLADGWLPSLGGMNPDRIKDGNRRIDEAALAAGRQPADIRRVCNIGGQITDGSSAGLLNGPVDQWIDQLTELAVDDGIDGFILSQTDDVQLRRFATEIAPAVRANLTRAPA